MRTKSALRVLPIFILARVLTAGAGQANQAQIHPFVQKKLVYRIPGTENVVKRLGIPYLSEGSLNLKLDLYLPAETSKDAGFPVVILVNGYSDPAIKKYFGVNQKDLGLFSSWAELIAASGMAAVTYESVRSSSESERLIEHLRKHAGAYGIDPERLAVIGCSANTLTAQSLMQERGFPIRCAVLYYPILATPDKKDAEIIAASAKRFGFYWTDLREIKEIRKDVPLFVVSVGKESHSEVKATAERFVREALSLGVPITFVHYADGQHDFDVQDDTPESRAIIRQTVDFLRLHLMEER
jgi:dienelactone hydrolase